MRRGSSATNKVIKSDEEWKRILSAEQYYITRQAGTEAPYTSPLLNIHENGIFECICCDLALFNSTKCDGHKQPQRVNSTRELEKTRLKIPNPRIEPTTSTACYYGACCAKTNPAELRTFVDA